MIVRQDVGLFFLSVTGAFSLWSATNTSYTGHMAFGVADPKSARVAMNLGLGFIGLQAVALLLLYGRRASAASVGALVTGGALWAIYDHALKRAALEPPPTAGMVPRRAGASAAACPCAGALGSPPPSYFPAFRALFPAAAA